MSSSQINSQYYSEMLNPSSHSSQSHRCTSSLQKVSGWLQTTLPSTSHSVGYPLLTSSSSDGKKMVHWSGDVEDNEKPPRHSSTKSSPSSKSRSNSRSSRSSSSKKSSSSSSNSKQKLSSSKDNLKSSGPPSTPKPNRLPTPELSDPECRGFCNCYFCQPQTAEEKMNTQLNAAQIHIAAAKQRGY